MLENDSARITVPNGDYLDPGFNPELVSRYSRGVSGRKRRHSTLSGCSVKHPLFIVF